MDKHPFIDHSILIPIGISIFSIVGILAISLAVFLGGAPALASTDPTATPFEYILLTTGTLLPEPVIETAPPGEALPEQPARPVPTDTPQAGLFALPASSEVSSPTRPSVNNTFPSPTLTPATNIVSPRPTATAGAGAAGLTVKDRFDDADPRLDYDGDWVGQTNVNNAYQRTLSVSNAAGSDLILDFTGEQIIIGYQGGSGHGLVTISIDDDEFQLDQSVGTEWHSPQLTNTEHFVIIIHESGGSVNVDYINVLSSN